MPLCFTRRVQGLSFLILFFTCNSEGGFHSPCFCIKPSSEHYNCPRHQVARNTVHFRPLGLAVTSNNDDGDEKVQTLTDVLKEIHEDASPKQKKQKTKKTKQRTKTEIKTMKFLMNQDVEKLIESNDPTASQVAEENIRQLQLLHEMEGNDDYKPRILSYNILVRAYGRSPRDDAPSLAEQALKRIISMYEQSGDEDIKPSVITYTEVIDSYARSKKKDAAEQAERILLEMMEEAEQGSDIMPSSITCDVVINAWAKRRTKEGAQRAERILERMEYLRTRGNEIQPSTYSFATVISAWAKSGTKTEGAERSEYILERLIEFKEKLESSEIDRKYAEQLSPDTVIYNSVLDAWARSGDPRAGTKAEAILVQMEEQSRKGFKNAAPDSITFNTVINCHANSKHISAAKSAEKILKKMEIAVEEASALGDEERNRIAPNTRTYNQVLKCYASSKLPGAPQRAEAILKYMLVSKKKEIQPDIITFCTCLDVWAKSNEKGKAERSYNVMKKLIELYDASRNDDLKPTVLVYNTVLNSCAFSAYTDDEERKKALSIAIKLFNEMLQAKITDPDAITYGTLIKCVTNLVPHENHEVRNKMASDIFVKCADGGLVNGLVFDEIRRAVPGGVLAKLLDEAMRPSLQRKPFKDWELKHLPRKWKGKYCMQPHFKCNTC